MNGRQKVALVTGLAAFGLWGAYPSWERPMSVDPPWVEEYGHAWLWSGPQQTACEEAVAAAKKHNLIPADAEWQYQRKQMEARESPNPISQWIAEQTATPCEEAEYKLRQAWQSVPTERVSEPVRIQLRPLLVGWAVIGALTAGLVLALGSSSRQHIATGGLSARKKEPVAPESPTAPPALATDEAIGRAAPAPFRPGLNRIDETPTAREPVANSQLHESDGVAEESLEDTARMVVALVGALTSASYEPYVKRFPMVRKLSGDQLCVWDLCVTIAGVHATMHCLAQKLGPQSVERLTPVVFLALDRLSRKLEAVSPALTQGIDVVEAFHNADDYINKAMEQDPQAVPPQQRPYVLGDFYAMWVLSHVYHRLPSTEEAAPIRPLGQFIMEVAGASSTRLTESRDESA